MKNNFTISNDWVNALPIRYGVDKIIKVSDEIYFYKDENILKCQNYFNFEISKEELEKLSKLIEENYIIKFSYINDSKLYSKLLEWVSEKKYILEILDEWDAPQLEIENIEEYLKNNRSSQVKKNYKQYENTFDKYKYISSNSKNALKLWTDVLYIDYNSWKGKNKCDMKSLDREDLQYIFYLLNNEENTSLNVTYESDLPCAYSLMFRGDKDANWYAVKWGATDYGRTKYLGLYCLFNHLIKLGQKTNLLSVDFWGRRSRAYDYLKNKDIKRLHFQIKKER